jgi:septation ring formation regulator EzrA
MVLMMMAFVMVIMMIIMALIGCRYIYTRKNAQVVTNLQQTCSNNLSTGCVRTACSQLVDKLSTAYY